MNAKFFTESFELQDTHGLPIDVTHDLCKENGIHVDWLAALCKCWLNSCLKYDSFVRQASLLANVDLDKKFKQAGAVAIAMNPEMKLAPNPVDEACRWILANK